MTWPRAVQVALDEARKEGYLAAVEDIYAAILAGDLFSTLIELRKREGLDETEPLCLSLESRIGLNPQAAVVSPKEFKRGGRMDS